MKTDAEKLAAMSARVDTLSASLLAALDLVEQLANADSDDYPHPHIARQAAREWRNVDLSGAR